MLQARHVMNPPGPRVGEQTPVRRAAELLATNRLTILPVVDDEKRLVGMVSEADLVGDLPEGETTDAPTVGSVMTRQVVSMPPDADLGRLTHWVLRLGLRAMPITDGHHRLVGIVNRTDLMLRDHPPATRFGRLVRHAKKLINSRQVPDDWATQASPHIMPVPPTQPKPLSRALRASDIMSPDPARVAETVPIELAMEQLQESHYTALPVVNEGNFLVGMVSEADFIRDARENASLYPWSKRTITPRTVQSIMNPDAAFGWGYSELEELVHRMLTTGRRVMPIVDDGHHLIGVVTRNDLMRAQYELNLH